MISQDSAVKPPPSKAELLASGIDLPMVNRSIEIAQAKVRSLPSCLPERWLWVQRVGFLLRVKGILSEGDGK